MVKKTGLQKNGLKGTSESVSIQLIEISDTVIEFDSQSDASKFLGLRADMIATYVRYNTKIIKSKQTGKTYLIKKVKAA